MEKIIDQIGALDLEIKALQKARKDMCLALSGLEHGAHDGLRFVATVVEKIDWRLDTKALKKEFGDAWYEKRCKLSPSRSIRTKAI
jgi:hypothetical protein